MFEDIKEAVNNYITLKRKLDRVESFLKESLRTRINNTKPDILVETMISLIGNQRPIEDIKLEEKINELEAKEFNQN
jgi:hypothetical protein